MHTINAVLIFSKVAKNKLQNFFSVACFDYEAKNFKTAQIVMVNTKNKHSTDLFFVTNSTY